jgi:hypothetical protein
MVNVLILGFWLRWASAWAGVCLLLSLNTLACPAPTCSNHPPPYRAACSAPPCYTHRPPRPCRHPSCARPVVIHDESITPPEDPIPPPAYPTPPTNGPSGGPQNSPCPPGCGPIEPIGSEGLLDKILRLLKELLRLLGRGLYQLLIALAQLLGKFLTWLLDPQDWLIKWGITLALTLKLKLIIKCRRNARELQGWRDYANNLALYCPLDKLPAHPISGTYNRYRCQDGHQFNGDPHRL